MAEIYDLNQERWRRRGDKSPETDRSTGEIEVFDYTDNPNSRQQNIDSHPASKNSRVLSLVEQPDATETGPKKATFESIVYNGLSTVLTGSTSEHNDEAENPLIAGNHRGESLAASIQKHKK